MAATARTGRAAPLRYTARTTASTTALTTHGSDVNLQQLRDYIRTQLDMDDEELPNALLDSYLNEAFQRTISMESRWPFLETSWAVAKVPDVATITLPEDCDTTGIDSFLTAAEGNRLVQVGNELAQDRFGGQNGSVPAYYSIHGTHVHLWPQPDIGATISYYIWGHRFPRDWITEGPDTAPDCDVRLHILLAHYAIALVYAMEEDEVLEDTYMKRFQSGWLAAHSAICRPRKHRPLIFNVGIPGASQASNPVIWGPPVGP